MREINAKPLEELPEEKINYDDIDFLVPEKAIQKKLDAILSLLSEKKYEGVIEKEIMNIEELSQYTGFSIARLYKLKADGIIPFSQSSRKGKIFFQKKEIDFWLQNL